LGDDDDDDDDNDGFGVIITMKIVSCVVDNYDDGDVALGGCVVLT
jgi:hypothetical protein